MLLWCAPCCSTELFFLSAKHVSPMLNVFLLCWVFSSLPSVFFSVELFSSPPSVFLLSGVFFLLWRKIFFSAEHFSSLSCIFLLWRGVVLLCGVVFLLYRVEKKTARHSRSVHIRGSLYLWAIVQSFEGGPSAYGVSSGRGRPWFNPELCHTQHL